MKTGKNLGIVILLCMCFIGSAQTKELKYIESMSAERKGTKSKQLEGMEGTVEKVIVTSQTSTNLDLEIHFTGYSGKNLKVLALSKSGNPKIEILPYAKKVSSGKERIKARLRLMNSKETSTNFIELVFTNGIFRFKGISYVYEFNKNWFPKESNTQDTSEDSTPPVVERTPEIIELKMRPLGKARDVFMQ